MGIRNNIKGFTLVELMIVVAIVGILAAVMVTTYQRYQVRAHRADVKAEMAIIAQNLAAYRLANNDYGANSSYAANVLQNPAIYGGTSFPLTGQKYYDLNITPSPSSSWTLEAKPSSSATMLIGDGDIKLTDQGWRCWSQGNPACTPLATSSWDVQ